MASLSSTSDLPDRVFGGPRVQPCLEKYFDFHSTQSTGLSCVIPFPIEGRFAVVTDVGFGMRWTLAASLHGLPCGRTTRLRTGKSCGPDAPTLASSSRRRVSRLAGDSGKKARSLGRARRKPLKPLRRECRLTGEPVVTNSRVFSHHARLRVQRAPGIPCA